MAKEITDKYGVCVEAESFKKKVEKFDKALKKEASPELWVLWKQLKPWD